ncbi:NAD(P)/FAD-dependent oxidoreductase [Rhodophyticola sp. CCM32]|uniref:NAD(P)/FAD-dependent oxidoreductase n=1 Tax=Rhodophyticola sp. CCM32 TaxID=2916397 RepID=UPI001AEFC580|nr:FAD-binding oxidoreductase [Rhodophyticola sp. CCM32]
MRIPSSPPTGRPVAGRRIAVLGAGMVGVCVALDLQARGADVTLIDRADPGRETSFGNAGVFARSSLIPINNPGIFADLPRLLSNRNTSFRYDPGFLMRNAVWAIQFLNHARGKRFAETAAALDGLIRLSIGQHLQLLSDCNLEGYLSDGGWMFLYRDAEGFRKGARAREMMQTHDVDMMPLGPAELQDLEPGLNGIFPHALWIRDSYSVSNPGAIVEGYAREFVTRGGGILKARVTGLEEGETGALLHLQGGEQRVVDHAALCLGPWARAFLEMSGYRVRMAYERGYHRHFSGQPGAGGNKALGRPVYDTSGGYVLAPMEQGLRLTTGVELCERDAVPNMRQILMAEQAAREAIDLGPAIEADPWVGSRPTFPDSRPVIGPVPGARHVSVAFGHQHIGFMTGPGTASLLGDLIEGRTPLLDPQAFSPDRFIRRR